MPVLYLERIATSLFEDAAAAFRSADRMRWHAVNGGALTQGLDPEARRATWELIREIRPGGTTAVRVTHVMDEAEHLCER